MEHEAKKTYYDFKISALKNRRNAIIGKLIVLRDITARKETENRLQAALEKLQFLQQQLYEQTIHDPLTGLYNRRYLNETLTREIMRAERKAYAISFVLLDVDYFKKINDTLGHIAGDKVLQKITTVLLMQTRTEDMAFRFGGEEFLVVMPNTPVQSAQQYAERCRVHLQGLSIKFGDERISVTISAGIAVFPVNGITADSVIMAADKALYAAKSSGRNCVKVYDQSIKPVIEDGISCES